MKTLIAILANLVLSGCGPRVSAWEINSMQQQCVERGGLETIDTVIFTAARCMDGKWVHPARGK